MKEIEFKKELKEKANQIGLKITDKELSLFFQYKKLVLNWNEKINLTAIKEDEDFINKHFIDSLTISKYIQNKEDKIIDIGTGAGFPGIPIKIVKDNKITLFDALNKRLKVLDNIIEELKLENIETLHGRAEEIFRNKNYRENYDVATSRAVASLNVLAEYMLPAVKKGGKCICMKADDVEKEIEDAKKAIKILGGRIETVEKVVLPETQITRSIIIIRKEQETPNKYPRKPGTPTKEPIK